MDETITRVNSVSIDVEVNGGAQRTIVFDVSEDRPELVSIEVNIDESGKAARISMPYKNVCIKQSGV